MIPNYIGRKIKPRIIKSIDNISCVFNDSNEKYTILGGASSQSIGGDLLGDVLTPSNILLTKSVNNLKKNKLSEPLNLHTSIGVTTHLNTFINSITPYVPHHFENNWYISIQSEGASAIHTAVDILLSRQDKTKQTIAVGQSCYHGPKTTSYGNSDISYISFNQLFYPIPILKYKNSKENMLDFNTRIEKDLDKFIKENKNSIGVIIIEPQWGSAGTAQYWPKDMLRKFIDNARKEGIFVITDEIMCGLGRHGHNTLFLSDAWNLNVDAITFGKAIAGGVYPISGVIIKNRNAKDAEITPIQSHTYSHGTNVMALITASRLLDNLPSYFPIIKERELIVKKNFEKLTNNNMNACGQGLLWGIYIQYPMIKTSKDELKELIYGINIIVYHIPDGLLFTPIYNCNIMLLDKSLYKLVKLLNTIK